MRSLAVLIFLAGGIHLYYQVPLAIAGGGAVVLWILWRLKWIILGILGLEMLFGGDGGSDA